MKRSLTALVITLLAWVAISVYLGRFTRTDEIAFKAAGREWASSGRFAAPELAGFLGLKPPVQEVWLAQPPLYTFGFGLFVKLFGFGATQNVLWDALIHAAVALLTFALCRRYAPEQSSWWAFVAAVIILPFTNPGRPDDLAAGLGVAATLVALQRRRGTPVLTGIVLGLCVVTSFVAAAAAGMQAVLTLFRRQTHRLRALCVTAITSALTITAAVAPILFSDPSALDQFTSHARSQLHIPLAYALRESLRYGAPFLLLPIATIPLILLASKEELLDRFAGPLLGLLLVLAVAPSKYYYVWFIAPLLIAAACSVAQRARVYQLAAAMVVFAAAAVIPLRELAILATLPSDQKLDVNVATIRRIVPPGSRVMAAEFWSSLADDMNYVSLVHGTPEWPTVQYVILTSNGSGAVGRVQQLSAIEAEEIRDHYEVIHDNLPRHESQWFGLRISRSAWGFGSRIYKRRGSAAAGIPPTPPASR